MLRPDQAALSDELAATVGEYHRALDRFVTGDPRPLQDLYSRRDDATIANPFGPPQRGWPAVQNTTARAAGHYADGRAIGFDEVSKYETPKLAYTVELEYYETKVGGSPDVTPVSLRVTTVFRREEGGWRVVHRHADPATTPRGSDAVIASG